MSINQMVAFSLMKGMKPLALTVWVVCLSAISVTSAFAQQLGNSEQRWVTEAQQDLERALSDPRMAWQERIKVVERSAKTLKEYGQEPAFPKGDIPLKSMLETKYRQSMDHYYNVVNLLNTINKLNLDQKMKIINTMQVDVVGDQIELLIPGIPHAVDLVRIFLDYNAVEGWAGGKVEDAAKLTARFKQLLATNQMMTELERLRDYHRISTLMLHEDLEEINLLQEELRKIYQNSADGVFVLKGYENATQVKRDSSGGANTSSTGNDSSGGDLLCSCEDWNDDGKFGVVKNGKIVHANYGTYGECLEYAASLDLCKKTAEKSVSTTCTCEDWNKDGDYGIVYSGKVLRANIGPYPECMKALMDTEQCLEKKDISKSNKSNKGNMICTCEDWNKDGMFGVVIGDKIISANYGPYEKCMEYARTLPGCFKK